MNNKEKSTNSRPMKRGPGGPNRAFEKPKNFGKSVKRLLKNLNSFKMYIIIALILAMGGSILSLVSPNKLSDLTDEIQKGIVLNTDNLKILTKEIETEFKSNDFKNKINNILSIKLDEETITNINLSDTISSNDKLKFNEVLSKISTDSKNIISYLNQIPDSVLSIILPETSYNNEVIKSGDKKVLLEVVSNINGEKFDSDQINNIPLSIKKVLLNDTKIDNKIITSEDKFELLNIMGDVTDKDDINTIYKKVDELPKNIKSVLEPKMNMNNIKSIAKLLVYIYLLSALFTFIQSILMTDVSNKFAKRLRSSISNQINKLPLRYFDRTQAGDILSRVTNDVDTIAQSMNQSLSSLVSSLTLFIGSIIMMFYTNYIMAITAILSSLIGFILMSKILSKSQKYFTARQVELGKLNGHIEEIYSGLNVVKVYNGKKESDKVFDELNKNVYECNRKSQFLSGLMQPLMGFIGNFGYVSVCIVGAVLTSKEIITFGVIVAFIMYVRLFTNPLSQIAQAMTSLQSTAAASERVFEFLDEEQMKEEVSKKELKKEDVKGKVEFSHVKFGYNDGEIIIKDFSAKIKPGQKVAIVGPTGAGKTTIVNLLMKFYDINEGDIKIDGISIKDLSRENVHNLFTMVLQDTWLFNGTVKENIAYNKENVTDEEIIDVCKKVGIHHFIKTLPKGYNSILSDNDSVSSGQRQLLTIARGMIDNSPLLILDEATSNVDTRTEELVQKAMDKLAEGKTSFIIAHRLSTIKNADLILVMKDGNIIEQGNHDELLTQNGFYANLYNSQFEKIS